MMDPEKKNKIGSTAPTEADLREASAREQEGLPWYKQRSPWIINILKGARAAGINAEKRLRKAKRQIFTRSRWNELHRAEINRDHKAKGLNKHGSPVDRAGGVLADCPLPRQHLEAYHLP